MKKMFIAMFVMISAMAISTAAEAASCNAQLRKGNGDIRRSFYGWGYSQREACRDARRQCHQVLSKIRMRRSNARAYCTVNGRDTGRGGGYNNWVTRTCRAEKLSYGGYYRGTYYGQASGYRGNGIKRRACDDAMHQCQRSTYSREYCRLVD